MRPAVCSHSCCRTSTATTCRCRPGGRSSTGRATKVPLMIGTTHDEGSLLAQAGPEITGKPLNNDTYKREVARYASLFSPLEAVPGYSEVIGELAAQLYPLRNYPTPPGYDAYESPAHLATGALMGDALFACSAKNSYTLTGAAGSPHLRVRVQRPLRAHPARKPGADARLPQRRQHLHIQQEDRRHPATDDARPGDPVEPHAVLLGQLRQDGEPERVGPAWRGLASASGAARS